MASLKTALKEFVPALHDALRQCARRAVPVALGAPFAMNTVKGSLGAFERLDKQPHVDILHYTLPEAAQAQAELAASKTKTSGAKASKTEGDKFVPLSLPLWCSKFGGFGYLPKSHAYPTNVTTGTPLMLLAQINFGELRAQWTAATGKPIDSNNVFLEEPLWPTRGVLAFYTDPFDDVYGCDFSNVHEQKKFRVLYFEDADDVVAPVLRKYWDGAIGVDEAEATLANLMWTREEQYNEFLKAYNDHEDVRAQGNQYLGKPENVSTENWEKYLRLRLDEMWKGLPLDVLEELGVPNRENICKAPSLWYGNPINAEYPMVLVTEDMPLDMVPLQSVEFKKLVVEPALKDHPEARRAAAGDYYALPSQFTHAAAGEGDEFGDENAYEVEYGGKNTIGGFPTFTQDDPRDEDDFDMLLFSSAECSEKLMWGDAGVGNFFISAKDLANREFGKAWYSWDCC